MSRYLHLPVFQDAYDLVLDIHKRVENFPRIHRYSIGEKIKNNSFDLLDLVIAANSAKHKSEILAQTELSIEKLKIYFRLTYDLRIISAKGFEYLIKKTESISRQIIKWKDWSLKQNR